MDFKVFKVLLQSTLSKFLQSPGILIIQIKYENKS